MSKIQSGGIIFNIDENKNPVIKEIIVEKVVAVPNATMPNTNQVISVVQGINKTAIGFFSKRDSTSLTGQYIYLGNIDFKKSDYEDSVSEFTAKVEYIVEALSASSSCTLKLYNFSGSSNLTGSEVSSGTLTKGQKIRLVSPALTLPDDAILECLGKTNGGSVDFLSAKLNIEKKRKS